ncbi:MAG: exodeoxyribonuclease VII small subunit [Crocinitomicaceae bacterium]|jgi:exodeoxyribonuclease VII small subunit|nr:exodeoxyribonuclease VII small subunit [Crocinitomicaceae bacterium]
MEPESYSLAFEELQRIVSEMERGDVGIDELAVNVKRAAELIQYCKNKLKATELDVAEILKQLEEDGDGA